VDELTAAGVLDPDLRASYAECKRLNSLHGKTYYLATLLLPKAKRPHVHALYGFARYAWGEGVLNDIRRGTSEDHVGRALVDTVHRFNIPIELFEAFLHSMTMDLSVTHYETYEDLIEYVYGSAAVIGLQMVPILGTSDPAAYKAAEKLGIAFQLANFIRDVSEDLDRGRIYLPLAELAEFGVTPKLLAEKKLTPEIRNALAFQIARVRRLQSEAASGIKLLDSASQPCINAASELYCGIVDEVEKIDYEVFTHRATTSTWRRLSVALPAFFQALRAR
jgi:phytoene synthase